MSQHKRGNWIHDLRAQVKAAQQRPWAQSRPSPEAEQTFTCPKCAAVSYNPNDAGARYCGACREFFP